MTYLFRRSGHFYFRVRVPKDLLTVVGRSEIKKALHAVGLQNAKHLAKLYALKAEKLFTLLRGGMLTDDQIRIMLDQFLDKTLREAEDDRAVSGRGMVKIEFDRDDLDRDEVEQLLDRYWDIVGDIKEQLAKNDLRHYEGDVDALLEERGLQIDKESLWYKKLRRQYVRKFVEALEIDRERARANYDNAYDRKLREESPASPKNDEHQNQQPKLKLSDLIEKYVAEKKAREHWTYKTEMENLCIFDRFLWIVGDLDAKSLENSDVFLKHLDALTKLPPNYMKRLEFKGKSAEEVLRIVEQNPVPAMSIKTRNKAVQGISTLMEWAVGKDYIRKNYAANLGARDKRRPSERRSVYETKDLKKLFSSVIYREPLAEEPEKPWIPLLALFSGARLNEICSLYLDDIRQIEGIWCFDINQNRKDKRVKTDSSERGRARANSERST